MQQAREGNRKGKETGKEMWERDITEAFQKYDKQVHPSGCQVYNVRVVSVFKSRSSH